MLMNMEYQLYAQGEIFKNNGFNIQHVLILLGSQVLEDTTQEIHRMIHPLEMVSLDGEDIWIYLHRVYHKIFIQLNI